MEWLTPSLPEAHLRWGLISLPMEIPVMIWFTMNSPRAVVSGWIGPWYRSVMGPTGTRSSTGGKYTNVFVGLIATMAVLVASAAVVGEGAEVRVTAGNGVPVTNEAPGVRNTSIQLGCVSMEASIASINPSGLRVRKSLFGSSCESILVLSCQRGTKRSAS